MASILSLLASLTLDSSDFIKNLDDAQDRANSFKAPEVPALNVDKDDFEKDLEDAEGKVNWFKDVTIGAWEGIKDGLKKAGLTAMIGKLVQSMGVAVRQSAELGDEIDKGSKSLGISTRTYQELDYALKLSGGSVNDLAKGMSKFRAVAEDGVTEEQAKKFEELGINASEAASAEELMLQTLTAISGMDQSRQGYFIDYFFGKNNKGLSALLSDGTEQFKELMDEASDYGAVMSDEQVQNSVAFLDSVTKLETQLQGLKNEFAEGIVPLLTDAVEKVHEIIKFFTGDVEKSTGEVIQDADERAKSAGEELKRETAIAEAYIDKLAELGDYSTLDKLGQGSWNALAQSFMDKYPQFAQYVDLENKKLSENTDFIKENIEQFEEQQRQLLLTNALEEKQAAIVASEEKAESKRADSLNKVTQAEGERAVAISKINDLMEESGSTARLDTGASLQDAYNFINQNTEVGSDLELELVTITDEWAKLEAEAKDLRQESENLQQQTEEASAGLEASQQALTEYMTGVQSETATATSEVNGLKEAVNNLPDSKTITIDVQYNAGSLPGRAIGDRYVPFDMPVMVHRGEEIRTATAVRRDQGGGDFSGLEDRIEAAIRRGMAEATVNTYLNGQSITDDVNRNSVRQLKARRFAP